MAKTETFDAEKTVQEANSHDAVEMADEQDEQTAVRMAEFEEVEDGGPLEKENLSVLLDVQMPITAVLGTAEVPFRRLLQLGPGSVLELDQAVGQPAELYVQGVRLATGDVVVVDDHYGLRIRQVMGNQVKQIDPTQQSKKA
jgi:flagellar motor switch protein FliN/FliY